MTDKEYSAQKARVNKYIKKWLAPIGLGWQEIDMYWERERNEDNPATAGLTSWHWQYHSAAINWYLPAIAELNDEKLEGVVVHEFAHILSGGMGAAVPDDKSDIREHATETIARALIWARKAGQKD